MLRTAAVVALLGVSAAAPLVHPHKTAVPAGNFTLGDDADMHVRSLARACAFCVTVLLLLH